MSGILLTLLLLAASGVTAVTPLTVRLGRRPPPRARTPPVRGVSHPPGKRTGSPQRVNTPLPVTQPQLQPSPSTLPSPPPPSQPPRSPPPPVDPGWMYTLQAQATGVRAFSGCPFADDRENCLTRVELRVPNPTNPEQQVWAPLCMTETLVNSGVYAGALVKAICKQHSPAAGGGFVPLLQPFFIPSGPVTGARYLNPAAVQAWATFPDPSHPNAEYDGAAVIPMTPGFKVSTTPCASGKVLAYICVYFGR